MAFFIASPLATLKLRVSRVVKRTPDQAEAAGMVPAGAWQGCGKGEVIPRREFRSERGAVSLRLGAARVRRTGATAG
jgi:hypothetical protein